MGDNEFPGSACYVQWVWASGTVSLYVDARNFSYTPSIEFIDRTAGADDYRRRLTSFKDATASLSMLAQSDGTAILTGCEEGTQGTLTFGEAGTVAGKPKTTMPAIALGVSRTAPYNDVVVWDIQWQGNGDPTYSTWGS